MSNARYGLRVRNGLVQGITEGFAAEFFLLDIYPNAAAAYSLRKLRSTYTGSAIRVRRSNDNAEQDIGFGLIGLDTAALLSFVGANNGFVTTWYDQSGNNRNATQTTAANQPQIVSSGSVITANGKPTVQFDGSNDNLISTSFTSVNEFIVSRVSTVNNSRILQLRNSTNNLLMVSADGRIRKNTNNASYNGPLYSTSTNQFLLSIIDSDTAYQNSNLITSKNSDSYGVGSGDNLFLGVRSDLTFYLSGSQQELIFYASDQSSNRTSIETNINDFYSIY
jgi:hypothetical protein